MLKLYLITMEKTELERFKLFIIVVCVLEFLESVTGRVVPYRKQRLVLRCRKTNVTPAGKYGST